MTVASRTPEGDAFSCRVCGAADRVEPSPLTGDAVCPRCGGYLDRLIAFIDAMPEPPADSVSLDTDVEAVAGTTRSTWPNGSSSTSGRRACGSIGRGSPNAGRSPI